MKIWMRVVCFLAFYALTMKLVAAFGVGAIGQFLAGILFASGITAFLNWQVRKQQESKQSAG